ncbi:MAG: type II toxin-antitoxin system VapC family toxin [Cytophagales bacterium]|nr:type II toxin-antitoxin system VapC family toxin [Cytophagales bacterium]
MLKKVYIDTSVVGGYFDEEFEHWTKLFFKTVEAGKFTIAVSEILYTELNKAPDQVKQLLSKMPVEQKIIAEYNEEAKQLANKYLKANIVGKTSLTDCRHIATATVNELDILTSWNFKHIVNLDKIHLYNGVNLQNGYRTIEIRTPRELLNYENI